MSSTGFLQGLEESSQKHEKTIVVEFAADRFLHTLGVHFMILLAVVAKVTEIAAGEKSSCYSSSGDRKYNKTFILYSNVYCWESLETSIQFDPTKNGSSCYKQRQRFKELISLEDAGFVKSFAKWLPYGMLIQAFLLSLPSVWWHFRVGARLMGHLKFMKLLLEDIYNATKTIPAGIYRKPKNEETSYSSCQRCNSGTSECICPMTDRDMFSLLCYENFSSMTHHTYVRSIFALTSTNKGKDSKSTNQEQNGKEEKTVIRTWPLKSTVLEYWCHQNNFGGTVLVRSYEVKHVLGITTSAVGLFVSLSILAIVGENGFITSEFLCDVLFHENACLLCTVPRMSESVGFLSLMIVMTTAYVTLSLWQLLTFRKKNTTEFPDFLNSCKGEDSIALLAAYKIEKDEEGEKPEG